MLRRDISISLRLTLWFGVIFFVGWALFGTAMWFSLKRTLTAERRQTLTRRLDRLQELLRKDADATDADRFSDVKDFATATGNGLSEVLRSDGAAALAPPTAAAAGFAWPDCKGIDAEQFVHVSSGEQPYWVLARPVVLGGQRLVLLAAAPEAGNLLVLDSFWRGLVWAVPILLVVSSAAGYWISRRALDPVDRMTATVRSIGIRNLSERVAFQASGDELQRLAETCNDMLGRLESAVRKLRQFTADASHELRGPLSFTRTVAEVALRNPAADAESRVAFEDIVEESAKAGALLDQMLMLARADAEPFGMVLEPLDLYGVVADSCETARKVAAEKGMTIGLTRATPVLAAVDGNAASLSRLVWILLDNGLKYTSAPGRIDVVLAADKTHVTLSVTDNGAGIAEGDLPYIFDRFYRVDPSRSQVEGSGLGLAIAKWIADAHRAVISVESRPGEGTTLKVAFPVSVG